jgi:hypothetical protein
MKRNKLEGAEKQMIGMWKAKQAAFQGWSGQLGQRLAGSNMDSRDQHSSMEEQLGVGTKAH